jgi:glutamate/tyrosine decarboxylase-like PLP-dependent enzyme
LDPLLRETAERAGRYLEGLRTRRAGPAPTDISGLDRLGGELPASGLPPADVLALLDEHGSPATVASAGGRYFGFVIGSALPAALAGDWLAAAWNQNAASGTTSPTAARLEQIAVDWTRELLGIPNGARGAFVSGATMANFTALAAARHAVLAGAGWDVTRRGIFGAPHVTVLVGEEVHVSVLKALSLLGWGTDAVTRVPVDGQGRLRADRLPAIEGPTIVCAQAGNVNSGACDPLGEIADRAHAGAAWVHVDGAFGLWAYAAPNRRALVAGTERADSWATDGHKWLNVPYDSGMVFVREPRQLRAAMSSTTAAYLPTTPEGEPMEYVPEISRRARSVAAWAALRSLGRDGVADLVERCCRLASRFADRLRDAGFRILNDVVLNQVLVSFGTDERTRAVITEVQREGTCWAGGSVWHETAAMRISVSSWATTEEDVERSAAAIVRIASGIPASGAPRDGARPTVG